MSVRLLSLNLWNINAPLEERMDALFLGLSRLKPDVICLQEVSYDPSSGRLQSEVISEKCNLPFHTYSKSGAWQGREEGLAIISRTAFHRSDTFALPEAPMDMPRQLLATIVSHDNRQMIVANTHLAFRLDAGTHRKMQVDAIVERLCSGSLDSAIGSCVLCGDLNDVPDSAAVKALLESPLAFRDVFGGINKLQGAATFSSRNGFATAELGHDRWIDYIFVAPEISVAGAPRLVFDGQDDLPFVSDHFGLFCELGVA